MKRSIYLFALLTLFAVGCSEQSSVLAPVNDVSKNESSRIELPEGTGRHEHHAVILDKRDIILNTNEPNWITLPIESGNKMESPFSTSGVSQFSTSGWINKDTDSEFIIDRSQNAGIHGEIKIILKLKFYQGSVSQNTFMTVTSDLYTLSSTFTPSHTFLKPGELYVKCEGLDLTGINAKEIDFVYMNANGAYEFIQFGEIIVDKQSGILELKDGKIPHFSRYGFIRSTPKFNRKKWEE